MEEITSILGLVSGLMWKHSNDLRWTVPEFPSHKTSWENPFRLADVKCHLPECPGLFDLISEWFP